MRAALASFAALVLASNTASAVTTPSSPITVEPISSDSGASGSSVVSLPIPTISPISSGSLSIISSGPISLSSSSESGTISIPIPSASSPTIGTGSPIGPITPSLTPSGSAGGASVSAPAPSGTAPSSAGRVAIEGLVACVAGLATVWVLVA